MEQSKPFSSPESPLTEFASVCQQVRAALDPARAHAISLHDEKGDVLWLTESSMGPDEHNAVREALDAFSKPNGPPILAYDLGDAKSAMLLRAVNVRRALVGAVMAIVDTRLLKQDAAGVTKLLTPKLQRAIADFAIMRSDIAPARPASAPPPPQRQPTSVPSVVAIELSLEDAMLTLAPSTLPTLTEAASAKALRSTRIGAPPRPPVSAPTVSRATTSPRTAAPANATAPAIAAAPPAKRTPEVTPEIDRLHAALRRSPIALHVQRLIPLTKGSQLKRYEVLLRSKSDVAPNAAPHAMLKAAVENGLGSMIDRRVVTELIGWLVHHPDVWKSHAVLFSVNLTTTALYDEHFIKFIDLCLAKSALPKAMIGFEIDVMTAIQLGDRIAGVAAALHRLGCPIVLDDFGMRTECFDLLRLPAVRYIKLSSEITFKMRSDKLSQAAITAVVQMARVMGMHTVAKRTETAAEQEWLTALGVDFIQSNALSPPTPIESLAKMPAPKT
jgi:EAL domain-containing protein (putative c-di-GMP-specific phosphodiesterase class I)